MKKQAKIQELSNLSKDELLVKERALKEELFKLNAQRYSGRVEKPHMFSLLKKDVARIKTLLNAKKSPNNIKAINQRPGYQSPEQSLNAKNPND
jgi:large subunit ribosomal protein L29